MIFQAVFLDKFGRSLGPTDTAKLLVDIRKDLGADATSLIDLFSGVSWNNPHKLQKFLSKSNCFIVICIDDFTIRVINDPTTFRKFRKIAKKEASLSSCQIMLDLLQVKDAAKNYKAPDKN